MARPAITSPHCCGLAWIARRADQEVLVHALARARLLEEGLIDAARRLGARHQRHVRAHRLRVAGIGEALIAACQLLGGALACCLAAACWPRLLLGRWPGI